MRLAETLYIMRFLQLSCRSGTPIDEQCLDRSSDSDHVAPDLLAPGTWVSGEVAQGDETRANEFGHAPTAPLELAASGATQTRAIEDRLDRLEPEPQPSRPWHSLYPPPQF